MDNILEKLCIYDPANPNYVKSEDFMPPPRQKNCYCDNCFYGRDALAMEAIRLKGRIAINVNRIKELEAALKWIVNCTDSEMGDGDGARTVAEDALNSRAVEFIQEMLGVEVEIKPENAARLEALAKEIGTAQTEILCGPDEGRTPGGRIFDGKH